MDRRSFLVAAGGSVAATAALSGTAQAAPPPHAANRVRFNLISDIQGDLADFGRALDDLAAINPGSAGLGIVGDITPRGYDFEYDAVKSTLDKHPHPAELAWVIGNHEFYVPKWRDPNTLAQDTWPNGTTEESLFASFYRFTGRDTVYTETSFGGVPLLCLGTERYSHYHDPKLWDEVWMSDEQFGWLEDRLAHWAQRRTPVMVLTHHPLPNTVSGTQRASYAKEYLQAERLLNALGRYPDVFVFTGHTHYHLELPDWTVRRVVPGSGNLEGFTVVNTGAIETGWRDNGEGGEETTTRALNQGLQIEVGPRDVLIKARDFATGTWLKQITVPLHNGR
ncbi:protein of unknown function [Saccharopolyspora antimicrobica]|uniref:Uncharacterized protein DUF4073 n=1 Tax=Saccharopolyspora antimicrobica TaxID=455193 RepID=A0A1I5H3Z8_9PSEU|nr:DUF4073 domain-containing protein [Saccharopolyspora antimicrobica]RKT90106.1 uncharacterized protein DUF4073 [Saccharopolyspora antimicrobica]SFO42551.1 protein of unknown function [Saccharopolyspora antimicrobica]